jgi:hypothetical protein
MSPTHSNALDPVYGHTVEGTNPSLLRAMGGGTSVPAYDVDFNREVDRSDGGYFGSPDAPCLQLDDAECSAPRYFRIGRSMQRRAQISLRRPINTARAQPTARGD